MSQQVDYDRIAATYDQRFADNRPRSTTQVLLQLAQGWPTPTILEVGCGTGRWLADLRPVTSRLFGLDLSAGMLRQAGRRDGQLGLVHGRAADLPLADTSCDLVYCVNAIHHFDRQQAFIEQALRVLRPGGALAIIGFDPRQHRDKWYVYDYFDGVYQTDLARFPTWGTVLDWMQAAGLDRAELRLVEHIVDHRVGRTVLEDRFLRREAASQLTLLSDDAYATGMARIQAALASAEASGESLLFPVEIRIQMLVGWRPPATTEGPTL